jgi:membrane protease YdiL (CAAX protease family)
MLTVGDLMLRPNRTVHGAALLFAMLFPSVLTLAYFVLLASHPAWLQQAVYAIGKTIQFAFPALVVTIVRLRRSPGDAPFTATAVRFRLGAVVRLQVRRAKRRLLQLCLPRSRWFRRNAGMLALGVGFGLLVLAAMFGLYQLVWKSNPLLAGAGQAIRQKIVGLGLDRLWVYVAVGVFYALCHSALEEYYWRWFVFGQLRSRVRALSAVAISSLAFMAHHVILLATYFGWSSPWTYAFSLSVALGGAVWAWLYERSGSLIGPWLSHLVVDAAIFLVGYGLARDLIAS